MTPARGSTALTGRVIVMGSVNCDQFVYVDEFPVPGETILARGGAVGLGGKGANQAVVASRLGSTVSFIGQIGDDASGKFVTEQLERFGVSSQLVMTSASSPTGSAHITVSASGENTVAVISGANGDLLPADVANSVYHALQDSKGCPPVGLAQGETSVLVTETFAGLCAENDVRFVLNLAPVVGISTEVLQLADPLIVNEGEARSLIETHFYVTLELNTSEDAVTAASLLAGTTCRSVIITLGAAGAVAADGERVWHQASAHPERVVDTTGAGDAFVGAVVAVLASGGDLAEAVRYGAAAGSLAVTKTGTTDSYPSLDEVNDLLNDLDVRSPL